MDVDADNFPSLTGTLKEFFNKLFRDIKKNKQEHWKKEFEDLIQNTAELTPNQTPTSSQELSNKFDSLKIQSSTEKRKNLQKKNKKKK